MRKWIISRFFMLLTLAPLLVGSDPVHAAAKLRLVLVVAKGSRVTDLSRADLKRIFTNERVTGPGSKLVAFNHEPGSPERVAFDIAVFGMTKDQMGRFWVDRKIRGQASAPRALPSEYMAKVVEKFPNAIGYLPEHRLTQNLQPVSIDGVAYAAPDYDVLLN
jgi:hypothetical protein